MRFAVGLGFGAHKRPQARIGVEKELRPPARAPDFRNSVGSDDVAQIRGRCKKRRPRAVGHSKNHAARLRARKQPAAVCFVHARGSGRLHHTRYKRRSFERVPVEHIRAFPKHWRERSAQRKAEFVLQAVGVVFAAEVEKPARTSQKPARGGDMEGGAFGVAGDVGRGNGVARYDCGRAHKIFVGIRNRQLAPPEFRDVHRREPLPFADGKHNVFVEEHRARFVANDDLAVIDRRAHGQKEKIGVRLDFNRSLQGVLLGENAAARQKRRAQKNCLKKSHFEEYYPRGSPKKSLFL